MSQEQEVRDAVEVSLSLLEEHCQDLESIKEHTTLTVEQLIPVLEKRAIQIRPFYNMIDHLEASVRRIHETVERMEQELTIAENLFSSHSSFNVTKVFTSLLNPRKKNVPVNRKRYEAPVIFNTSRLFAGSEEDNCEEGSEVREDGSPPIVFNAPQSEGRKEEREELADTYEKAG